MKINSFYLISFSFFASINSEQSTQTKTADREFLLKQRFLLEIVYRIGHPLQFEEWIPFGKELLIERGRYVDFDDSMVEFYESSKSNALLARGEFFGSLVNLHRQQALGLFKFFHNAQDWDTFMRNVCWARINANEGMFIFSLTLALVHRKDLTGLVLPSIQEIIPEYFFHEKFIFRVAKFNFDNWMSARNDDEGKYIYAKEWKMWQWWRVSGLDERFYLENLTGNEKTLEVMSGLNVFWMPLDYTRDIEVYNEFSKLAYFAEDVGWNSYWYYLNLQFSGDSKFNIVNWFEKLQQIMARYYMERLSQGFGEIENFSWEQSIANGYDSQLYCYNGVGFSYRRNNWKVSSCEDSSKIRNLERRIGNILDLGYFKLRSGETIFFKDFESTKRFDVVLQESIDVNDHNFLTHYMMLSSMYFGAVGEADIDVFPNVFMNYETMMRDPMFYIFYRKLGQILFRLQSHHESYKREDLLFAGIKIEKIVASKLMTFSNFVDFDVSTLLNDEMKFIDGRQFQWNTMLKGRQIQLDHRPFHFHISIRSNKIRRAVVRIFLGPKYDEFGRMTAFEKNCENFMKFDEFTVDLGEGKNIITRDSSEMDTSGRNHSTYTELYRNVVNSLNGGRYDFKLNKFKFSSFPDNLILPRGWIQGMPVQLFFMITPYGEKYSFNYPFDRFAEESSFIVPNIYFKNVKIYHENILEKYEEVVN